MLKSDLPGRSAIRGKRASVSLRFLRPRKTILLYGPPGCGKSLGAKRIAWNTGLPLMKVRFDALISSYLGSPAANLRAVFDAAKERPCVLLLDECDFIARSRVASKDIGEVARIVNTLLQLMEDTMRLACWWQPQTWSRRWMKLYSVALMMYSLSRCPVVKR